MTTAVRSTTVVTVAHVNNKLIVSATAAKSLSDSTVDKAISSAASEFAKKNNRKVKRTGRVSLNLPHQTTRRVSSTYKFV
jgi:hypothetical protein